MATLLEQINIESKTYQINNLVDIKYGFGLPERDRIKGSIPVYASSGLVGFHNEARVDKPAIIIGRKGNIGSLYYTETPSFPIDTTFFIDEPKKGFDLKYIFYLLKRINLPRYGSDSAVPGLSRETIYSLSVKSPELPTQKKIAEILDAYDTKIENNNKIIKNLEAVAQTIFNEWFVLFHFPGYEKVKMTDSEIGEIPEGWQLLKIKNLFDIKYGKNLPTSKISANGRYPVYGAGGVIGFYNEKNSDGKNALVTCRGNGSGTIWRTRESGFITNNSFITKPTNNYNYINFVTIYFILKNGNIMSAVTGSAQPQITIEGINSIKVTLPEKNILNKFQEITIQLFNLMDILFKQNQNLKQSRDQLLAKLI